jgi:REP element-mobilizing transposase RayT
VHVLIEPKRKVDIGTIVGAWKSVSARSILAGSAAAPGRSSVNAAEGGRAPRRKRRLWQPDYWDRFIRNERHYRATVDYIHDNPVKVRLVARAADWSWSSAGVVPAR